MKIYFSAPIAAIPLVKEILASSTFLRKANHSSWIHDIDSGYASGKLKHKVVRDCREIDDADVVVIFYVPGSGGGMFSELGYAVGVKKRIGLFHLTEDLPRGLFAHHPSVDYIDAKGSSVALVAKLVETWVMAVTR